MRTCAVIVAIGALAACGDDAVRLAWVIEPGEASLLDGVSLVHAEVRSGRCEEDGAIVWSAEVRRDDVRRGMEPPDLERGTYAFFAEARDAECNVVARGCTTATLPSARARVVTVLEAATGRAVCLDAGGIDAGGIDAGDTDAGRLDAGMLDTGVPDAGARRIAPANVSPALLDGTIDVTVTADATFDTTTCASETTSVQPMLGGGEACVSRVHDLDVQAGVTVTVVGSRPLIILATGRVRIEGRYDLSGRLRVPGAGGFAGAAGTMPGEPDGMGPDAGRGGAHVGTFTDGGGGGGALCGAGGAGGTAGLGADRAAGGAGGPAVDATWELEPLRGGSGGGRGAGDRATGANGGGGGGALQITAAREIVIAGAILVGGGGGAAGLPGASGAINIGAGGGGGAGGAVLLEAPSIVVSGRILATGGGGGGGAACYPDGPATPGEDGAQAVDAAGGGTHDATECGALDYGADGGDSGGGAMLAGTPGESTTADDSNGGGGGGGAGCILFRTEGGAPPALSGLTSPRVVPGIRTLALRYE